MPLRRTPIPLYAALRTIHSSTAMAEHMRAWQCARPGDVVAKLKLNDKAPRPSKQSLKADEILIKVVSASLNPADYKVPGMGLMARGLIPFPKTIGMDLSGQVAAFGEGITDVKPGDSVVSRLDPLKAAGSLSEYVVAPRDTYAPLSGDANLDWAAAIGTAGLTAYQCIKPHVKPGDKIFINGGSGGTGTFGIQIGKLLGCHVTVSCSTAKAALCKDLGADEVIDYKTTDVREALKKAGPVYNLLVDNVGTSPPYLHAKSSAFLTPEAPFVLVAGGASLSSLAQVASAMLRPAMLGGGKNKVVVFMTKKNREDLSQLAQWLAEGKLRTVVESTYDFADAVKAFEHLKKGSVAGKLVVHVAPKA
ncbi:Zinc-type alcohol dehydrogenase-like protein C16A3.02c [Tolypocladium ophioglossoides CBS 100239]|uniref:Zinc-type alcohol dehydrogenase-like protein C16A3.02c n=1 Tax=Tolypocladium ophioglossoides (strain CBS 100239) TaxID=1163406 RepID=A0A0L0NHH2_TOLOC|nr:Zinc-type alcohol dehydrogenase-like protein C16A3.02c [Tolypocladium ophioglossoides CBS 100239]